MNKEILKTLLVLITSTIVSACSAWRVEIVNNSDYYLRPKDVYVHNTQAGCNNIWNGNELGPKSTYRESYSGICIGACSDWVEVLGHRFYIPNQCANVNIAVNNNGIFINGKFARKYGDIEAFTYDWNSEGAGSSKFPTQMLLEKMIPEIVTRKESQMSALIKLVKNVTTQLNAAQALPGFNSQKYLEFNPDVAQAGVDPAQHFISFGYNENRKIQIDDPAGQAHVGTFNLAQYLQKYDDLVSGLGLSNALIADQLQAIFKHYQQYGYKEGRSIVNEA